MKIPKPKTPPTKAVAAEPQPPADALNAAEKALADNAIERAQLREHVATADARRAKLLADDASIDDLESYGGSVRYLKLQLERAEAVVPRLQAAVEAARKAEVEDRFEFAYGFYLAAQQAFLDGLADLARKRDELERCADAVHMFGRTDYAIYPRRDLPCFEPVVAEYYRESVADAEAREARRRKGEW